MKKIVTLLLLIIGLSISQKAKASHVAGGDLSYVCLGGNQYQINLNLFIDCLGFDPGASQTINFTSSCGGTATGTVNVTNPGGTEISQLCPADIGSSTCSGGALPGMWVFHFTGTVTLAPPCDTWTMSWTVCCRNAAILNLVTPASFGSYIQATINSATAACNNSPSFTAQPIPYVCINQLVNYSYGVVETDGDSLYYSLINALDAAATPLTYTGGYSATSPIPGIVIDPNTGLLTFTPTMLGNFVVVVLVQEYDSAGNLIGTVMRDIQFIVQNCTNIVPDAGAGAIAGLTGTAVQTGPFSLEMCEGSTFTYTATYTDTNSTDILTYISNILAVMPGATVTTSGTNPLIITYSWTAPGGSAGTNTTFSVTINDGACPVPGQQTFVYDVNVQPRTLGGGDHIICGTQTANLIGTGGSTFTWNVLSGPPMVVGTNFSCNPCANPVASPTATTTYEVVSDLSGTCVNRDTVTVTVVPDFTAVTAQSATSGCLLQPIQFNASSTPAGSYTYLWSPSTYLDSPTIANPTATVTAPGTYTYYVTVTSPLGCVKVDTASITVQASYPPNALTTASDTVICAGETINLGVLFGSSVPSVCGINPIGCAAALVGTVGTVSGASDGFTYPAPFSNWFTSVKQQFLFTAAELNAAGITGGKLDQLDWEVNSIPTGAITTYHEFTIRMGCTNLTTLGPSWVPGLYQVFNPATVNVALGWNSYLFNNAFEWDGISNVVVELCSTEGPPYPNYTNNLVTPWCTTTFTSTLYSFTDGFDMCPDLTNFVQTATNRPITRFHYCGASPDSTRYTYSWIPTSGLTNPNGQYTNATVPANTNYQVIVTDTVSGCVDTASINIVANSPTVSFTANPTSGFYPLTVNFTNTSDPTVVSVIWNFGDTLSGVNNTSTLFNPSHTYANEGHYTVTLVGVDANGCTDTVTATIDVMGQSFMFIPNVFTPGGANPTFLVTGFAIDSYMIQIYNRWGKKLFESADLNDPWNGGGASDGTYFYIIKAKGKEGKEFNEKGFLQLIGR